MLSRDKIRKVTVAVTTFSVALGIGFVMQNGDALASRLSDAPAPGPAAPQVAQIAAIVVPPEATQTPDLAPTMVAASRMAPGQISGQISGQIPATPDSALPLAPLPVAALPVTPGVLPQMPAEVPAPALPIALETEPDIVVPEAPVVAATPDCAVSLTATTQPAAMVQLDLAAPCLPDQIATIHHQGIMFTILTASDGTASVTVPALAQAAVFLVDLGNDQGAVAVADVPEIAMIDRAVLQWQGSDGIGLHALEFGARYGSEGHVWAENPRAADAAVLGQGGFVTRLGDAALASPMLAEVYTFPTGATSRVGTVDLSVEAVVTPGNCGRELAAQSLQITGGGAPVAADLTMVMPDCDAVGERLVLSNMLADLTLAAR